MGFDLNLQVIRHVLIGEYFLREIGGEKESCLIPAGFMDVFLNHLPSLSVLHPPHPASKGLLLIHPSFPEYHMWL